MLLMLAAGAGLVFARIYGGPRRGARRGRLLHRPARRPRAADRPAAGADDAALPALRGRGAGGRGGRPAGADRAAAALRSLVGRRHRHRRPRRRVGLVADLDAAALAVGALPRGRDRRLCRGAGGGDDRRLDRRPPRGRARRATAALARVPRSAAPLSLAALVGFGLYTSARRGRERSGRPARGRGRPGGREVAGDGRARPADAAEDAEWFDVTAWQGGGLVVDRLERTGPGRYRTTEPIPVSGNWKTMIRLHKGNSLTALPIYLPARRGDPGRRNPGPAAASPATSATSTSCCSASRRAAARSWSRSPTRSSLGIAAGPAGAAGLGAAPALVRGRPRRRRAQRRRRGASSTRAASE